MAIQLGGEGTGGGANFGNLGALYLQSQALGQQRYVQPRFQGGQPQSMGDSGQGNLTDRDVYQAGAQRQLQSERFQGAAQLNQVELNQAEQIQLQRLKAADAAIDTLGPNGSGQYDAETVANMKARVRLARDPLEAKAQASRDQILQEQASQLMHQNAQVQTLQQMDAAGWARHLAQHTVTTPGGNEVYIDQQGRPHPLGNRSDAHAQETREDRLRKDFLQHAQHIEDSVNRGDPDEPVPAAGWDQAYADRRQERNVRRRSTIDGRLQAMFGHANVDDYLDAQLPGRAERRQVRQRAEVQRSLERGVAPPAQVPAQVHQQVGGAETNMLARIGQMDVPEDRREDLRRDARRAADLLRRGGGHPAGLPRTERQEFEQLQSRLLRQLPARLPPPRVEHPMAHPEPVMGFFGG